LFQMMSLKNQTSFSKVASYTKAINLQILQWLGFKVHYLHCKSLKTMEY
jgi:hypothetical protein